MSQPHSCPPIGICLPIRYRRTIDGDTIEVSLPHSDYPISVRLKDCWCPEISEPGGDEAAAFTRSVMEDCEEPRLFVPIEREEKVTSIIQAMLSYGRFVGVVWVSGDRTLNGMLIEAGHATEERKS